MVLKEPLKNIFSTTLCEFLLQILHRSSTYLNLIRLRRGSEFSLKNSQSSSRKSVFQRFLKKLTAFFGILLLVAPITAYAEDLTNAAEIIINEIAASEPSDTEWIEIYNKGETPVDLNLWKFFENNTNHGLTAWRGDAILAPRQYAIIANKPETFLQKYPAYAGKILDSSWGSLKEAGEEIGLKDANGNSVERFIFPGFEYRPAENKSLERINQNIAGNIPSNWKIHLSGNSIGENNSSQQDSQNIPTQQNEQPITSPQTQIATTISNTIPTAQPVPVTPTTTPTIFESETRAEPTPQPINNQNTENDLSTMLSGLTASYEITCKLNKKSSAKLQSRNRQTSQRAEINTQILSEQPSVRTRSYTNGDLSNSIKITELLPNPSEGQEEWIEIFNNSNRDINLGNWQLKDSSKTGHYLIPDSIVLQAGEYRIFQKTETNIALNNSNETISLFDFNGAIKDSVKYEKSQKGNSYALIAGINSWEWSNNSTPGEENPIFETIKGDVRQVSTNELGENALEISAGSSSVMVFFESEVLNQRLAQTTMPKGSRVILQAEKTDGSYILRKIEKVEPPATLPSTYNSGTNIKFWITGIAAIIFSVAAILLVWKYRRKRF